LRLPLSHPKSQSPSSDFAVIIHTQCTLNHHSP
jgi:hypothetical protein